MTKISAIVLLSATAFVSVSVNAAESGGVKINGDVQISASGENVSTQSGNGVAQTSIGAVKDGVTVDGDVNITAQGKNITTKTEGGCAETSIGVVGKGACQ